MKLTDEAEESEEQKNALSDKTRIRGVDWGDFKDEAMADNFDPSFWFYEITDEERDKLNRLIAA